MLELIVVFLHELGEFLLRVLQVFDGISELEQILLEVPPELFQRGTLFLELVFHSETMALSLLDLCLYF